jgi:hypothetical protein
MATSDSEKYDEALVTVRNQELSTDGMATNVDGWRRIMAEDGRPVTTFGDLGPRRM